jgi:hypothetical protein
VALRNAKKTLFSPLGLPHSGGMRPRSVVQTPFRTVSPRTPLNRARDHSIARHCGRWKQTSRKLPDPPSAVDAAEGWPVIAPYRKSTNDGYRG